MCDNIKVVVKVRPLIPREIEEKLFYQWRVKNDTLYQIDQYGKDYGQSFTFDKVYDYDAKTTEVFNDIAKPIVEAAIAGINGTIFAYGQTSSGKTYTMTGPDYSPGIIPLAVLSLFDTIKDIPDRDFLVRVSFVEIYNETLIDLLDVKKNVKIHETLTSIKADTTEKVTSSPEEVFDFMRLGKANRQTASTIMNDESSRSHSIFQITIESRVHIEGEEDVGSVNISQLNLVDLAGSERAGQTGATGIRFKEGTLINKSLSTLALVIKQLSEGHSKYVSYRDSKLTRLLQNSLGGNAKTSIICAVTPAAAEETISTLQFACRAKAIRNTPEVNAVDTEASMIQNLTKQLGKLRATLENKKNVEQDNCNLQKQIAHLQKVILNGFHQRSSEDVISGARRKLYQPRRVTISTLYPIQEDAAEIVPKFCTPSVKYNALTTTGAPDFAPIRGSEKLPCCPEEPARAVTPPSNDKKSNLNDEIIVLDSDEDVSTDVQTCSPHHSCYDASKTPPCILRRNFKEAEKNYRDILTFTEREKLFPPDAVELMEKLEEKSSTLSKLQQDFISLNEMCIEKDKQIKQLQDTINLGESKLENITTAKSDLDALCKEYQTKLIDWEVSYETLMKKTKTREKELLSLLEEQSFSIQQKENGKMYTPPKSQEHSDQFVGCADVISTKSSSSDSDVINNHFKDMASEIEERVALKQQTIIELQATITAHKDNIETLEKENRELNLMVSDYRRNVLLIENENAIYKSKINDLNSLVVILQTEMISLKSEIDSYNAVVQDLQETVISKDKLLMNTVAVDDKDIESMINTEKIFIANNENIRNIIQSLKSILDSKNEELRNIKTIIKNEEMSYNYSETIKLHEDMKKLQQQLDEKVILIQNYTDENHNLIVIAQDYAAKNTEFEVAKANLESINAEYVMEIQQLKDEISQLHSKAEFTAQEEIKCLEEDIKLKNKRLETYKSDEDFNSAKLALTKLQDVIILLCGNVQDIPDLDDFASIFKVLSQNLNTLQIAVKSSVDDKRSLQSLINKYEIEIMELQGRLDNASTITSKALADYVEVTKGNNCNGIQQQVDCELLTKIETLVSTAKETKCNLNEIIQSKDDEIGKLKIDIEEMEVTLNNKSTDLTNKIQELHDVLEQNKSFLDSILEKVMAVSSDLNIEKLYFEFTDSKEFSENVLVMLNNFINNVKTVLAKHDSHGANTLKVMADTKTEVKRLNEENLKLTKYLSEVEKEKCVLAEDILAIKNNKEQLISDLTRSNRILAELQSDFKAKSSDIEMLKNKAHNWKEKFINVDTTMKLQLHELKLENTQLREELERLSSCESIAIEKSYNSNRLEEIQGNSEQVVDLQSPQSLLTICCEKIFDAIQSSENEQSASSTNSKMSICDSKSQPTCSCLQLQSQIEVLQVENDTFRNKCDYLQMYSENLVEELEDAKIETRLLIESTYELQKKIGNHRTNLSTLTATTYAENKSLSSQLKSLQHYQSLYYKACEKDIPEVKRKLQELWTLLQNEYSGKHNESFRRFSLPATLENCAMQTSKCESMLDGDLLMLDTNITLTTCDNTLTGHDQSGFEVNISSIEVDCPINNCSGINEIHNSTLEQSTSRKILETVESLKLENHKLREIVEEYEILKQKKLKRVDSQNSPIKLAVHVKPCGTCVELQESLTNLQSVLHENDALRDQLSTITNLKCNLEVKIVSMEALKIKVKNLERDLSFKSSEISKLTSLSHEKNKQLENIQEENDALSNQIMDNIHEADSLKREMELLKQKSVETSDKYSNLKDAWDKMKNSNDISHQCRKCVEKDDVIKTLQNTPASESVSRYNKICTLQSEIHAGREDCNELKNEVTNIKNHLENNNLSIVQSMDLDESMGDSIAIKKSSGGDDVAHDMPEERPSDIYTLDKADCINYYIEKTGAAKETFSCDMRMIDVMKTMYTEFHTKHNNEMVKIGNKFSLLQKELDNLEDSRQKMTKEIEEKNLYLRETANLVEHIKSALKILNDSMNESELTEVLNFFKNNFFATIDKGFGSTSLNIFNNVVNLIKSEENQSQLQLVDKVRELNGALDTLKSEVLHKDKEYNLLQMQKERMFEINNAVTLNIVNKEKMLYESTEKYYHELVSKNLINKEIVDFSLPIDTIISILHTTVIEQSQSIKEQNSKLTAEVGDMKRILDEKNKQLHELQEEIAKLKDINKQTGEELSGKENQLRNQTSIHELLKSTYGKKVVENNTNLAIIEKLSEEVNIIKNTIECKEAALKALKATFNSQLTAETSKELRPFKEEVEKLKSINDILMEEKESASVQLQRANDMMQQYKIDLENLRETVAQSSKASEALFEQNAQLDEEVKEKTKELLRLETNIKTYQKSAEIQCKMISRLKTKIAEMEKSNGEHIEKVTAMTGLLEELKCNDNLHLEEINSLRTIKESLESRISELERGVVSRRRTTIDMNESKIKRQNLYDSLRACSESEDVVDPKKVEAAFKSRRCDELFPDIDGGSNRSSPLGHSIVRDSFSSRHDQSEEDGSRTSSVQASRRRRQSIHDAHRSVSALEAAQRLSIDRNNETSGNEADSEVSKLRKQLSVCREELEDWKEKFREVDEECEICATYLREREEQCRQLKAEKKDLEVTVEQLRRAEHAEGVSADVAVNTEEDWANLHAVVVDRMSYDAEVDKTKKLSKTIDELRSHKQELRNTLDKMQKTLEKNMLREKEATSLIKSELNACQSEVAELRKRNRELDEECELCSKYLKERDEQIKELQEAKKGHDIKLLNYQDSSVCMSVRKKRQTMYDLHRRSNEELVDAAPDACAELNGDKCKVEEMVKELKRVKMTVEDVSQQNAKLKQQLAAASAAAPHYVSTGSAIVQQQQLSDVIKENQKLKNANARLTKLYRTVKCHSTNRENEDPAD